VDFLIDGYNMMHAVGYLSGKSAKQLRPSRTRFLDWLATIARARKATMRVVFDGQNSPERSLETVVHGVRVRFAYDHTADDEIEQLIVENGTDTIIVSNDSRLHESARRAKLRAWNCDRFIDWTIREVAPEKPKPVVTAEKTVNPDDDRQLLAAFLEPRGPAR
jgi:uncharacterized protein